MTKRNIEKMSVVMRRQTLAVITELQKAAIENGDVLTLSRIVNTAIDVLLQKELLAEVLVQALDGAWRDENDEDHHNSKRKVRPAKAPKPAPVAKRPSSARLDLAA